jgi:hypothetical protein
MAGRSVENQVVAVADPVIERDEVIALLFNVSDIAIGIDTIVRLLAGDDDGEEEEQTDES